ncbi:hypothetical protein VPHD148_0294 [Vibrio phage D148]
MLVLLLSRSKRYGTNGLRLTRRLRLSQKRRRSEVLLSARLQITHRPTSRHLSRFQYLPGEVSISHYDCRHCGSYGCFGECRDPAVIERKAKAEREKYLSDNQWVLEKEHRHREAMKTAKKNLTELGEYDADKYEYLFE